MFITSLHGSVRYSPTKYMTIIWPDRNKSTSEVLFYAELPPVLRYQQWINYYTTHRLSEIYLLGGIFFKFWLVYVHE